MNEGPLVYVNEFDQAFRVLGGRRYRSTGSYVWVPASNFYDLAPFELSLA